MSPSLKIIVPTLNSYRFLDRLVSSLVSQTFPYWSVLFVDGYSEQDHLRWLDACCACDSRFRWIFQGSFVSSIFGAMNDGLNAAKDGDWILFWGSDDWASSPTSFECLIRSIEPSMANLSCPALVVCKSRYVNPRTLEAGRVASFLPPGLVPFSSFRASLFYGLIPPHQATLFSPSIFDEIPGYDANLRLASDLDFFLKLSGSTGLVVSSVDLCLVDMSPGGVSSLLPVKRLSEVARCYFRAYGFFFMVPFLFRYVRRILSCVTALLGP